jgi:hypothetical protein
VTFDSIDEITEYVRTTYRIQRQGVPGGTTPKLALGVARPSPLVERAIELSGSGGITSAELRRALSPPIAKERFEGALTELEAAGIIVRSLERRVDKRGHTRKQVVWRVEAQADPDRPETAH